MRREADIAIRQHPAGKTPAEPSALALKVGSFGFAAYASPVYLERHGRPERPVRSLEGHLMISTGTWAPGNFWNEQLEVPATYALLAYPLAIATAAAAAGIGIAVLPCIGADADPRLIRLSDVVESFEAWIVTTHEARNNSRIVAVKDALVDMIRAAAPELSGTGGPS